MRFRNPVPEQKCPAACSKLDSGKCGAAFLFPHTTSNCYKVMSNATDNRWKQGEMRPSSSVLPRLGDGERSLSFCNSAGFSYLCGVQLLLQAYRCTPIFADRHFLCPVATDMRSCNPVPERKRPAACSKLDNGKCGTVFYFRTSTSNCL